MTVFPNYHLLFNANALKVVMPASPGKSLNAGINFSISSPVWSTEVLVRIAPRLQSELALGMKLLGEIGKPAPWWDALRSFSSVFGELDGNHFFSVRLRDQGYRLTGPQLSKALAAWLSPEGAHPPGAKARCVAFITALRTLTAHSETVVARISEADLVNLKVQAEYRIPRTLGPMRLDLLLSWGVRQENKMAIECKLDHHLTKGQLSAPTKALGSAEYFVIAKGSKKFDEPHLRRNKRWRLVEWRPLLIWWNSLLPSQTGEHTDIDFIKFLRTFWERGTNEQDH
jgi:hypothetical protein